MRLRIIEPTPKGIADKRKKFEYGARLTVPYSAARYRWSRRRTASAALPRQDAVAKSLRDKRMVQVAHLQKINCITLEGCARFPDPGAHLTRAPRLASPAGAPIYCQSAGYESLRDPAQRDVGPMLRWYP